MSIPKLDTYERLAILAAARSGPRELGKVCEGLAGNRPLGAQVRLVLELVRRGHVDLNALLAAHTKAVRA
jgi:hypothetical protein